MAFDFAWNTQKNYIKDVKGKEREQERQGRIKNKMIDPTRTHLNYDFVESEVSLYKRVKDRRDYLKSQGSNVQSNSVVMNSNIITIPKQEAEKMSDEEQKRYFKSCYDYFCERYGTENVMSAKVHLDETTPHMHLHFMPVNKENGKLQARIAISPKVVREIHRELPKFLQERGFDVVQASGKKTHEKLSIHEYKAREDMKKEIEVLGKQVEELDLEWSVARSKVRTAKMQTDQELGKIEKARQEADREIAMIREEVSKFEYDINRHRERMIIDTEDLSKELDSTKKDLDHYGKQLQERIDSLKELEFDQRIDLDVKPNLLTKKVTMANETFEELKKRAESAEKMQRALRASEKENESLKESNRSKDKELNELRELRVENRKLQREVEFFKKVIDRIKLLLTSLLKKEFQVPKERMDRVVGYAKFESSKELGMKKDVELESEHEKAGFEQASRHFEEKQQGLDHMER